MPNEKKELPLLGCLRLLEPGPIVLVTTQFRGQANILTAAWVMPASHRPPLVALAIRPTDYTHYLLGKSQEFVINIPGRPLANQVLMCGMLSGRDVDKFAKTGLTAIDGRRVTVPWIEQCLAHMECGLVQVYEAGDHSIFLGEVIGAWAHEEAFAEMWLLPDESLTPLQHLGGRTFALLGSQFTVQEQEEA